VRAFGAAYHDSTHAARIEEALAVTHPDEDLIRALYDARGRADQEGVRSLLASDVRWHDPYPPPFGGDFSGIDEVVKWMFGPLANEMEDSGLDLHDVVANDGHAVALVNWWAVLGGRRMDGREIGVYHIRDAKIIEVWFMTEDKQASDAFFSRRSKD
jgi:ketosteroid isomerase-like protein